VCLCHKENDFYLSLEKGTKRTFPASDQNSFCKTTEQVQFFWENFVPVRGKKWSPKKHRSRTTFFQGEKIEKSRKNPGDFLHNFGQQMENKR